MNRILFLILVLYASVLLQAQQPVSIHLTEKDGLPDVEFYSILEDSKGFVWLAADKGLYRYDGKNYIKYTNSEKRGLSVFEPFEDHLGRIWTTNISGQFFYTEKDKLVTFIDLKDELKGDLVNFIVTKNQLVIASEDNIYTVDLKTKKLEYILEGRYWISNISVLNDVFMVVNNKNIFLTTNNFTKKQTISQVDEGIDFRGKLKIVSYKDFSVFQTQANQRNVFYKVLNTLNGDVEKLNGFTEVEDRRINKILDINNDLWVLTDNGIYLYNNLEGDFSFKNHFFLDESITDVIIDKDINYWISTLTNGIYIIPNIELIQHSLPENFINITAIDVSKNNDVLFGTANGYIGRYNLQSNTIEKSALLNLKVSSLLYNENNKSIYAATDDNSYEVEKNSFKYQTNNLFNGAKSLTQISKDTILFCTYNNVSYFTVSSNKKSILTKNKRAYTAHYSPINKKTYVGYVDNLAVLNKAFKPHVIDYNNKEILAISITETTDGIVWVGTFKNGVYAIRGSEVIQHYDISNGLLSNEIEYVQSDKDKLWIATSKGLQCLDTKSKIFNNLTKTDGIVSSRISGIEVEGDTIIVASNKGLFSFNKRRVFKTLKPSNIYFDRVEVNEKPIDVSNNLDLDYYQNAIKFNFNVNGIVFNQKGNYRYRLLGYNAQWITTAIGETSVKYNSLRAGNYTFQVQPVYGLDTNENEVLELKFSIQQAFWKTWWFISGLSILILSLTVLYFRRKIAKRELIRQHQIKQLSLDNELIALKLENLRSQMNPHFIFNALNSIQEYIVLNQKKLASDYLGKFADLIRKYLSHSTKGTITLQEEIECLEMYLELEKLRFEDKLHYTLAVSGDLNSNSVLIPTMLIQPYVENALKHGLLHRKDNRNLKITFFISEQTKLIKCIIVDNGVGRAEAKKFKERSGKSHKSFATQATEDRLRLLNYGKEKHIGVIITDLFEIDTPTGTQVEISIPFTID